MSFDILKEAKEVGFSDRQIGAKVNVDETEARKIRLGHDLKPWVKQVSYSFIWVNERGHA